MQNLPILNAFNEKTNFFKHPLVICGVRKGLESSLYLMLNHLGIHAEASGVIS